MTKTDDILDWVRKLPLAVKATLAFLASIAGLLPLWEHLQPSVKVFDSDYVYFNGAYPANEKFIEFLRRNEGDTVEINTLWDFSVALSSHRQTLFECNNAYYPFGMEKEQFFAGGGNFELLSGDIFNRDIEIPHKFKWPSGNTMVKREGCSGTLQIHVESEREKAYSTYGRTGMIFHRVKGIFDVHREISGANERIILIKSLR